jgi:hypothetical protein
MSISHPLGGALRLASSALDASVRNLDNARRITKFLRGRLEFEVRADDVFVSSYPRSGTTLTQWVLYRLAHDTEEQPHHLTQVSPWFERSLAIGELTAASLDRFPSPRVFKSHLPRKWLPDGARYVYVERDVRDVLVSYFHFYRAYLGFGGTLDEFYDRFMSGRVQYGSWFDHVAGWRAHAGDAEVYIVHYEDLLRDRRGSVERLAEFLGWERDEAWLTRVVEESSFESMKQRESLFDHATALLLERGVSAESFLRAGASGAGRSVLSEAQQTEIRERGCSARPLGLRGLAAFLQ